MADFLGQVTRAWEKDRGVLIKEQVCSYLGGQLENYCIEFLAEYTDDIIDMLVNIFEIFFCSAKKIFLLKPKKLQVNQYLNPDEICKAIAACP